MVEQPTRSDIMKFMDYLYGTGDDAFLYLPIELTLNWGDMCIESNVRNWWAQYKMVRGIYNG